MQDIYDAMKARVLPDDREASTVMRATPVETVKSILSRIGMDYVEGLPKDVYVSALKEELCSDRDWILKMIPRNLLEFLLLIWDRDEVDVKPEYWDYLQYLQIFGLAAFKRGNPITKEPNEIYIIQEMKDTFYFLLKSKKSRSQIEEYDEWEKVVCGMIYYYGMIDMTMLHEQFMRVTRCMVPYNEFVVFLKCRCSFWSFGVMLRDTRRGREYFKYVNVENAELLLLCLRKQQELSYKPLDKENLFYISEAAGIDNRWPGVSELGNIFLDDIKMEYYQATVMVKTLILLVQNGCTWEELKDKMAVIPMESSEVREKVYDALEALYQNTPVYELKGYSRNESEKILRQKQLKKRREMFTIIEGDKDKNKC
ncbi:MAG: hypothetical protein LUF92_09510 [Clostridiales bacterium]|nr:hypothetical protein [Clostridiales bacterium]